MKYNFIDGKGHFLSDTNFDDANFFSEGFAAVQINKKWAYINTNGDLICEPNDHN